MPNARIEKEAKMLLSYKEFRALLALLPFQLIEQDNYYYLNNEDKMFRFRQIKNGPLTFTHKIKLDSGTLEYEKEVTKISFDDPYIQKIFKKYNYSIPVFIGTLHTNRYIYHGKKGEICLDHSSYLKKEDYEFEYEVYDPVYDFQEGEDFLKLIGLKYERNGRGKFTRFRQEKAIEEKLSI